MNVITEYAREDIGLYEKEIGGKMFYAVTCKGLIVTDLSSDMRSTISEATDILMDISNSRIVGLIGFDPDAELLSTSVVCSAQIVATKEGCSIVVYTIDGAMEELITVPKGLVEQSEIIVGMTVSDVLSFITNKMEGGASASA